MIQQLLVLDIAARMKVDFQGSSKLTHHLVWYDKSKKQLDEQHNN